MANLFDDFDLDIQKVPTESKSAEGRSGMLTLFCVAYTMLASCLPGCVEVGQTSDQCGSQNCTNLSYCAGQ